MLVPHGAVLFEALLEAPQLIFHLLDRAVQGRKNSIGLLDGHKFIVMLGPNPQFQKSPVAMLQIDGHRNGRQPIKEFSHHLDFFGNLFLGCRAQMSVTGRNGRLHAAVSTRLIDRGSEWPEGP
jgi:hypothetical protein